MPKALKKRGREPEAEPNSTDIPESKRFNGEETDLFHHSPQLDKSPEEEEECSYTEDFVTGVMRSLEEEISAACSTFYAPNSVDKSSPCNNSRGSEAETLVSDSGTDLCYLLEASDDDHGIPSANVLDFQDSRSPKQTLIAEGLSENPDLKCQAENWDFAEEFANYQQFDLYEDAWDASELQDYMNIDFVSQEILFAGDFSAK